MTAPHRAHLPACFLSKKSATKSLQRICHRLLVQPDFFVNYKVLNDTTTSAILRSMGMHDKVKRAICMTIDQCPYEKAMIKLEQDNLPIMTPPQYKKYQQLLIGCVLAMDDENEVVHVFPDGTMETEIIDIDRIVEIFDPWAN